MVIMKNIFKVLLAIASIVLVAACGGGGGFSGTPNGPSATLRVFPPIESATVPVGYSYATVEIQGGRAPYVVTTSQAAVGVAVVDGNKLQISGLAAGTSEVAIVDQERAVVKIQVTATLIPMKSTIGADVSIGPKQSLDFGVTGGIAPYTLRSSDARIFTVTPAQQASSGPFVLKGVSEGTGTLTVTDSTGTDFVMNITVKAFPIIVTPAAGTGKAGTTIALAIDGGQAPFTVLSADASIADGSVSGDVLSVTLKKKGTTKLVIRDAQGGTQTVDITVDDSTLVVAPTAASTYTSAAVAFRLTGGVPPFVPVVSNQSAVSSITFSADNSQMLVTPNIPAGSPAGCFADISVVISVYDQTGSFRDALLTIKQDPSITCP